MYTNYKFEGKLTRIPQNEQENFTQKNAYQ